MSKIAALLLTLVLVACGPDEPPRSGTVIERIFTPASSGGGWSTSGDYIWTSEQERYTLILRDTQGVWSMQVSPEQWADAQVGETYP